MTRTSSANRRAGFSTPGVFAALTIVGILLAVAAPKLRGQFQTRRLDDAALVVLADLELASQVAAETRKPVRLVRTQTASSTTGYALYDRAGAVRQQRALGGDSEFALESVTLSQDTVLFFPNGVTSHPLTVTLSAGTPAGTRQVTMTRTGTLRIQ